MGGSLALPAENLKRPLLKRGPDFWTRGTTNTVAPAIEKVEQIAITLPPELSIARKLIHVASLAFSNRSGSFYTLGILDELNS